MIRMLTLIPDPKDATAFYRSTGPLSRLRRQVLNLDTVFCTQVDWITVSFCDIVFMQRPIRPEELQIARFCRHTKTPLWIDYDDYLFDIPSANPYRDFYNSDQTRNCISEIMKLADVISVSTESLKNCLINHTKTPIVTIANAFPKKIELKEKAHVDPKRIYWRGSHTHMQDLGEYSNHLFTFLKQNPDHEMVFIGHNPWYLTDVCENAKFIPGLEIIDYFKFLEEIPPSMWIYPLAQNTFNLCKSNNAWLEATSTQGVMFAPPFPEWERPGIVNFQNADHLMELIRNPPIESLTGEFSKSASFINEHLTLDHVNGVRIEILRELLKAHTLEINTHQG